MFLWRSSRTAAHPGVLSGLVLLVSLVSCIVAKMTLLLWRKVSSSVIFPLIPFAFYCISRRQLVGVGFDIAGTLKQMSERQCRHRPLRQKCDFTSRESSEVLAIDCAVGDPAAKRQLPFGQSLSSTTYVRRSVPECGSEYIYTHVNIYVYIYIYIYNA